MSQICKVCGVMHTPFGGCRKGALTAESSNDVRIPKGLCPHCARPFRQCAGSRMCQGAINEQHDREIQRYKKEAEEARAIVARNQAEVDAIGTAARKTEASESEDEL